MKHLYLMRHAKSDWDAGRPDIERPLNFRGRLAAPLMGAWLAEEAPDLDLALVSAATRTRETWERLSPLLPSAPPVMFREDLYECAPAAIAAAVDETPEDVRGVLVVGHNPGTQGYAASLIGRVLRFPTSAIAIIELATWRDKRGRLIAYEEPKGLV